MKLLWVPISPFGDRDEESHFSAHSLRMDLGYDITELSHRLGSPGAMWLWHWVWLAGLGAMEAGGHCSGRGEREGLGEGQWEGARVQAGCLLFALHISLLPGALLETSLTGEVSGTKYQDPS